MTAWSLEHSDFTRGCISSLVIKNALVSELHAQFDSGQVIHLDIAEYSTSSP